MSTVILCLFVLGAAFASWDRQYRKGRARSPWHHTLRTWLRVPWACVRRK